MVKAVRGLRLHLARAFDELEHRAERTGPLARYTVDVWQPRAPIPPDWWPWWPPVGVTALGGPVALQAGWALGTACARAARGGPVLLVVPVAMQRWVTDILLAHAGVPLHLIGAGALQLDQWQRISRRLGVLADAPISMMDPAEEPPDRYLPDTVTVGFCMTDEQLATAAALGRDASVRTVHVGGWADHGSALRLEVRGEDGVGIEGVRRSLGFDWPTLQVVAPD
ncbi:hypothetical protein [Euzebya rosea]|uniref:hypothetical protein n=1 Tax=Euzebya rosea TaxID=2052804 RepID=UPI000D3E1EA6|nr:hypothetical protein [Euzebya rosea]